MKRPNPVVVSVPEWRELTKTGKSAGIAVAAQLAQKADGTVSFVASSSNPDRHGDTVQAAGWKLDNFKRNPVLLWAHSHSTPPVGKVGSVKVADGKLLAEGITFTSDDEHKFGADVGRMVKGGFLNTVSVGFMPLKWEQRFENDEFVGFNFVEQELLELSVVPVPAHPEALLTSKSFASQLREWVDTPGKELPMERAYEQQLATFLKAADDVEDRADGASFERMVELLERIAKATEQNAAELTDLRKALVSAGGRPVPLAESKSTTEDALDLAAAFGLSKPT